MSGGYFEFEPTHRPRSNWPDRNSSSTSSQCSCPTRGRQGGRANNSGAARLAFGSSASAPAPTATVSGSIGPGEHEVTSLGLELAAERLILDERPARRLATSLGLRVIGTVGLLLAAKDRGFLAQDQAGVRSPAGSQVLHRSGTLRSGYRPGWRVMLLLEPGRITGVISAAGLILRCRAASRLGGTNLTYGLPAARKGGCGVRKCLGTTACTRSEQVHPSERKFWTGPDRWLDTPRRQHRAGPAKCSAHVDSPSVAPRGRLLLD